MSTLSCKVTPGSVRRTATGFGARAGRIMLLAVGCLMVGLGVAGVVLPVLPTTPFLVMAVACFARSSPRLHRAIIEHPRVGPPVRDWLDRRVIRKRAKWLATGFTVPLGTLSVWQLSSVPLRLLVAGLLVAALLFIWTRRSD